MQVKQFKAQTFAEAMDQVRQELGNDAIILDSFNDDEGLPIVRAARDNHASEELIPSDIHHLDIIDSITIVLEKHGVLPELMDDLINAAYDYTDTEQPVEVLAHILEQRFVFQPLPPPRESKPLMLIGPPGSGKSVACVKLASRALLQEERTCIIGADNVRVGGLDQLYRYCDRLGIDLLEARNHRELVDALNTSPEGEVALIDTPGVNPYQPTELAHLVELCDVKDIDIVLVIDGGRSSTETSELVDAFRHVFPSRLLVSKIDVARRVGSLLHAADQGKLAISEVSLSPHISDGLLPLSASSLARLMVSNVSFPKISSPRSEPSRATG
jgi:flagellar biosynthesis protein FlhF